MNCCYKNQNIVCVFYLITTSVFLKVKICLSTITTRNAIGFRSTRWKVAKSAIFICMSIILLFEPTCADSLENSPFILNRNIQYKKNVLVELYSTANGASEPRLLFYNPQLLEPKIEHSELFYTLGLGYSYKRIGVSIQYFGKQYRSGGLFSTGIDSKGRSILGYDKNQTRLETMNAIVIVPRLVLFHRVFADVAINVRISDLRAYSAIDISFSKKFEKIEYTTLIGFESLVGMLFFVPYEFATSLNLNLSSVISIFAELNYVTPNGGENYSSGFTNVTGINYTINKFISLSLFNHFLYNTRSMDKDLPYSRIDNRIGLELKFSISTFP